MHFISNLILFWQKSLAPKDGDRIALQQKLVASIQTGHGKEEPDSVGESHKSQYLHQWLVLVSFVPQKTQKVNDGSVQNLPVGHGADESQQDDGRSITVGGGCEIVGKDNCKIPQPAGQDGGPSVSNIDKESKTLWIGIGGIPQTVGRPHLRPLFSAVVNVFERERHVEVGESRLEFGLGWFAGFLVAVFFLEAFVVALDVFNVVSQCDFTKGNEDVQIVEKENGPSQEANGREGTAALIIVLLCQCRDHKGCQSQPVCKGRGDCQTRDGFLCPGWVRRSDILLLGCRHRYSSFG